MGVPSELLRRWFSPFVEQWHEGEEGDGFTRSYLARISVLGFGFTAVALSFTMIVLPSRVRAITSDDSVALLGILSGAGLAIAVLVQPLAGAVSDRTRSRWGRRRPFIIGGVVTSLPLLVAAGVAPTYVLLFIFICLLQIASNIGMGPYQALIRDRVPHRKRGAASGMKMFVEFAGAAAVTALVGLMIGLHDSSGNAGWLWGSMLLLALTLTFGMVVTTRAIEEPSPGVAEVAREAARGTAAPHPHYRWFLLSRFFIAVAVGSLQTFALFFLEDVVGVDNPAATMGMLILVVGAALLLVAYPAGVLADRVGRKTMMGISVLFAFLAATLLITAGGVAGLIVVGVLAGISAGIFLGAQWAMATDLVSVRRAAQQLGLVNVATAGGAALARLNGIWVDRLNGSEGDLGYSTLLSICGILFVAAAALLLKVRPDGQAEEPLPGATDSGVAHRS